jgi:peptidoglycan/LPS O-acetylase OafA/YrhL
MNPASPLRFGIFGAIGMACLSYYLIEQPLLRYRDAQAKIHAEQRIESVAA